MIENDNLLREVSSAIEYLTAIQYVYQRDKTISEKYLREKASGAAEIIDWLNRLTETSEYTPENEEGDI